VLLPFSRRSEMRIFCILGLLGVLAILDILATPVRAEKSGRLSCLTWALSIFLHPLDRNTGRVWSGMESG